MKALVVHAETGIRVGTFPSPEAAQHWIDGLGVTREYKERCYRIVDYDEYWQRWSSARLQKPVPHHGQKAMRRLRSELPQ